MAAIDQGTTSTRAMLFDVQGRVIAVHALALAQIYPKPGWVEHDPLALVQGSVDALRYAVQRAGLTADDIACVGIANQRETLVLWEAETGQPVHNAIVWQCRRTAKECDLLRREGWEPQARQRAGLLLDPYFSATKLAWLLALPGVMARAKRGELRFGTVDSWLAFNLCQEKPHVTDASNAARTLLYNIHTNAWDDELLRAFGVPQAVLPRVVDTARHIGALRADILGKPVPVTALAGDQSAALFGQTCLRAGQAKNTYGTGCFMLMNTGQTPYTSDHRLLTALAWRLAGQTTYALEGSVFMGGAVVQWLRDELGLIASADESEVVASSVPDSAGVVLVPAFAGLGAPYWDAKARGVITGLTRGAGRAHIVRAGLEAIAHQSGDIIAAMEADAGMQLSELRVDGGASRNNLLMQMQANLSRRAVLRPREVETTALGAAKLAGLAAGLLTQADIEGMWEADRVFAPIPGSDAEQAAQNARIAWHGAVARARFVPEENA